MKTYYFEEYENELIGCWECKAESLERAIAKYIRHLNDPSLIEDDIDRKFLKEVQRRLRLEKYEYDQEENTIYMKFTREELEQL